MNTNKIYDAISKYYSHKIKQYGATPMGVDWNSEDSQIIRFDKLTQICPKKTVFTLNDIGCGYGALYNI